MNLNLPSHIQHLIEERVSSGRYGSREEVVAAAITHLVEREDFGEFEAGEAVVAAIDTLSRNSRKDQ
jgi:putative addiction module CopG family antidote